MVYTHQITKDRIDFFDILVADTHYLDYIEHNEIELLRFERFIRAIFSSNEALFGYFKELEDRNIEFLSIRINPRCEDYDHIFNLLYESLLKLKLLGVNISDEIFELIDPFNPDSIPHHEKAHAFADLKYRDIESSNIEIVFSIKDSCLQLSMGHYRLEGSYFQEWRKTLDVTLAPPKPSESDFESALDRIHNEVMQTLAEYVGLINLLHEEEDTVPYLKSLIEWYKHTQESGTRDCDSVLTQFIAEKGLHAQNIERTLLENPELVNELESRLKSEMGALIHMAQIVGSKAQAHGHNFQSKIKHTIDDAVNLR